MNYFVLYSSETQKIKKIKERQIVGSVKGGHLRVMSTRVLTSLKWGKVTCPSKQTFDYGVLFSQGPSSDHCKASLVTAWVVNLNVRLSLTFDLTNSRIA
jgi:hypothetical protein